MSQLKASEIEVVASNELQTLVIIEDFDDQTISPGNEGPVERIRSHKIKDFITSKIKILEEVILK
jgi:hypothetical protein